MSKGNLRIILEMEAERCPYWDYDMHLVVYTCSPCNNLNRKDDIENLRHCVLINGDRYCTLNGKIEAALIEETTSD